MPDLPHDRPGHRKRLGITSGRWKRSTIPVDEMVEEYSIDGDDLNELTSVLVQLKKSPKPVKILTVAAENVKKAALLCRHLGVRGLIRDRSGLLIARVK